MKLTTAKLFSFLLSSHTSVLGIHNYTFIDDKMNDNQYTNIEILNLFYIHGECNKIVNRTCRTFNERYPNLPPMTKLKFRKIEATFIRSGAVKKTRNVQKFVTSSDDNQINILAYFNTFPNSSISAASSDLGKVK